MDSDSSSPSGDGSAFPTTQWTVIIEAVSTDPERAKRALEKLCNSYRQPIVNWFRRRDFYQNPEDLAHDFVAYLLEKVLLNKVDREKGKFRCFLAACMRLFLLDNWGKKPLPGTGKESVPLADNAMDFEAEAGTDSQLDVDFALEIHRKVIKQLAPAQDLKPYIFQKDSSESWDEIAGRLNKTSTAVRKEVSRLRRGHWENFRDEVSQIVTPNEKVEETRYLYELLFKNLPPE